MDLSTLAISRDCLNIEGPVSVQRDILVVRDLPLPRSLRDELRFIWMTRCRPKRPTDLRVLAVKEQELDLAWTNNSDNADGIRVSRHGTRAGYPDDVGDDDRSASYQSTKLGVRDGYNYTVSIVAFNEVGDSPRSNTIQVTIPVVAETTVVDVDLVRQVVFEGNIPYLGQYPEFGTVQTGRLLKISVPSIGSDVVVAFVRSGHTTDECGDPTAVVVLAESHSTTPEQIIEIFGVSEPQFSTSSPIVFVACASSSGPLLDRVPIEITIGYDD